MLWKTLITLIATVLVFVGSIRAENGLAVRVIATTPKFAATDAVLVSVEFRNQGQKSIRINNRAIPNEALPDRLFNVTCNGKPVAYIGPLIKRREPNLTDTVALEPGKSFTARMRLSSAYNLSRSGIYSVQYNQPTSRVILKSNLQTKTLSGVGETKVLSNTVLLGIEGRQNVESTQAMNITRQSRLATIRYSGCSKTRTSQIPSAVSAALTYSQNSVTYLAQNASDSRPRYTTWFGIIDQTRWSRVRQNFIKIRDAFNRQIIQLDCSCTNAGIYAYVYPSRPYIIYVCGAFWAAPLTGTDSRAGTLIHEMSHFTVVAGTQDYVYGQTGAANLAISSPVSAIANADNHEYFAENTPFLN